MMVYLCSFINKARGVEHFDVAFYIDNSMCVNTKYRVA